MKISLKKVGFIALFYCIALFLKYYIVIINPEILNGTNLLVNSLLYGLGPLIGGLILIKLLKRQNDLSIFNAGLKQTILVLLIPLVLFTLLGLLNGNLDFLALKVVAIAILYAIIEEYGWRGYLQTELKDLNKYVKYIVISVLWFFWHLEFDYSVVAYLIILAGSFGMGYVADKSKSLIYVGLFHAFINIFLSAELNYIPFPQKLIIIVISAVSIILLMRFNATKIIKKN